MTRRTLAVVALSLVLIAGGAAAVAYVLVLRGSQVAPLTLDTAVPTAGTGAGASTGASAPSLEPGGTPGLAAADLPGTWAVADGSLTGYRVREQLASLNAESDAVGRTSAITGQAVLAAQGSGLAVTSGSFTVDLTQLQSDDNRRDDQLRRQAIETGRFPSATFTLSGPVQLPAEAATGAVVDVTLSGELALHGLTKHVEIPAQAQLQGGRIQVAGSYSFPWSDFGIEKPNSFSVLSVADQGTLEFRLVLQKAS